MTAEQALEEIREYLHDFELMSIAESKTIIDPVGAIVAHNMSLCFAHIESLVALYQAKIKDEDGKLR